MAKTGGEGKSVVQALRDAIASSGQSLNQLSLTCGVGRDRLSRFVRGERDLTLEAADKICQALGLQLISGTPRTPPKKEPGPAKKRKGK